MLCFPPFCADDQQPTRGGATRSSQCRFQGETPESQTAKGSHGCCCFARGECWSRLIFRGFIRLADFISCFWFSLSFGFFATMSSSFLMCCVNVVFILFFKVCVFVWVIYALFQWNPFLILRQKDKIRKKIKKWTDCQGFSYVAKWWARDGFRKGGLKRGVVSH